MSSSGSDAAARSPDASAVQRRRRASPMSVLLGLVALAVIVVLVLVFEGALPTHTIMQ